METEYFPRIAVSEDTANAGKTMMQIVQTRMRLVSMLTVLSVGGPGLLPAAAQDFYAVK